MADRDSVRDSLQAELAVTRKLLAGMAAALAVVARHADLTPETAQVLLAHLRKDSRLTNEAADAAIAWLVVELAKPG